MALCGLLGACTVSRLDTTSKSCPCAEGWTCDSRTNLCVAGELGDQEAASLEPSDEADAADASTEREDAATPPDRAPLDAGPQDASPTTPNAPADATPRPSDVLDARAPGPDVPDAEAPRDAARDASPDVPQDPCQALQPRVLLEDGFERHLGAFRVSGASPGGSIGRSDGLALDGEQSLRVQTTEPGASAQTSAYFGTRVRECTLALNVALFVDPSLDAEEFTVIAMESRSSNDGVEVRIDRDGLTLWVGPAARALPFETELETDRWVQLELVVTVGEQGSVTAHVDGQVAAHASLDTRMDGGYERVRLGVVSPSEDQTGVLLHLDEFVLRHLAQPESRPDDPT